MIEPTLLERWLAAREPIAIRDAFDALPSTRHVVVGGNRKITLQGAAQLAGAMLGERPEWICERQLGPASYQDGGISDGGSYLDHAWRISERSQADLRIHERRDGLCGVQLISVSAGTVPGEGRPEGGGMTFVRVFAGARAVSIPIDGYGDQEVAMIGDVDLAPLDLYFRSGPVAIARHTVDVATARGLVAQLAAEFDAHYDTSTAWPEGPSLPVPVWYQPDMTSQQTFVSAERAVSVGVDRHGRIDAYVHGLPWGQQLAFQLSTGDAVYVYMRLPTAELDRIEARLAALATIESI